MEDFYETDALICESKKIYANNFDNKVTFERAVFFSWGCSIGDCTFCYMSTQPIEKVVRETKRSNASILAEFILAKKLGWDIGFFTGGIGALKPDELEFLLKSIYEIINEKIWLSVGPVSKPLLKKYLPYIKGIVGSTETINPILHKRVCPSKPLKPYELMFENAIELGLMRAMTFIVGMGEEKSDFNLLSSFIRKYGIQKIHVYGLIPQKGTPFENFPIPSKEQQAWWIAKLRIEFPKLDIQGGIWEDRVDRISYLLEAGSNSISKFKSLKLFGTTIAQGIEDQALLAQRSFVGSLTKIPTVDWNKEIDHLDFSLELKDRIKIKLDIYIKRMVKNVERLCPA